MIIRLNYEPVFKRHVEYDLRFWYQVKIGIKIFKITKEKNVKIWRIGQQRKSYKIRQRYEGIFKYVQRVIIILIWSIRNYIY